MRFRGNRARFAAGAAALALALTGCGTTVIDSGKAESLIRQSVAGAGNFKVKSVSCPDNVTPKAGGTFTCQLSLTRVADGSVHSGTVSVHEVDAKGHVTISPTDFHVQ
jgi:hypothetical protein